MRSSEVSPSRSAKPSAPIEPQRCHPSVRRHHGSHGGVSKGSVLGSVGAIDLVKQFALHCGSSPDRSPVRPRSTTATSVLRPIARIRARPVVTARPNQPVSRRGQERTKTPWPTHTTHTVVQPPNAPSGRGTAMFNSTAASRSCSCSVDHGPAEAFGGTRIPPAVGGFTHPAVSPERRRGSGQAGRRGEWPACGWCSAGRRAANSESGRA